MVNKEKLRECQHELQNIADSIDEIEETYSKLPIDQEYVRTELDKRRKQISEMKVMIQWLSDRAD